MRESGFDPSNRFGPFSADITDYVPVCLNALLYQMERDLAEISRILGRRGRRRSGGMRAPRSAGAGSTATCGTRAKGSTWTTTSPREPAATTPSRPPSTPCGSGAASPAQAARVARNLARFEAQGGLLTSTTTSGSQWDAPFGWAPLQLIAVDGLRRYGHDGRLPTASRGSSSRS